MTLKPPVVGGKWFIESLIQMIRTFRNEASIDHGVIDSKDSFRTDSFRNETPQFRYWRNKKTDAIVSKM